MCKWEHSDQLVIFLLLMLIDQLQASEVENECNRVYIPFCNRYTFPAAMWENLTTLNYLFSLLASGAWDLPRFFQRCSTMAGLCTYGPAGSKCCTNVLSFCLKVRMWKLWSWQLKFYFKYLNIQACSCNVKSVENNGRSPLMTVV